MTTNNKVIRCSCLVLMLCITSAHARVHWGPVQELTEPPFVAGELAYNNTSAIGSCGDSIFIALNGLSLLRSFNNGKTWEGPLSSGIGVSRPSIAVGNDGTIHCAGHGWNDHVIYCRSLDAGITWTSDTVVYIVGTLFGTASPDIDVDPQGNIHIIVSIAGNNPPFGAAYYVRSSDNGTTWSEPINLFGSGVTSLTADEKSYIHAIADGGALWTPYVRSTDAGISWNTMPPFSPGCLKPSLDSYGRDTLAYVFNDYPAYNVFLQSNCFPTMQVTLDQDNTFPALSFDAHGGMHVVYEDLCYPEMCINYRYISPKLMMDTIETISEPMLYCLSPHIHGDETRWVHAVWVQKPDSVTAAQICYRRGDLRDLALLKVAVHDSTGNNNGHVDPGETVNLLSYLKNIGSEAFTGLSTVIESSDPYLVISDNAGYIGSLAAESTHINANDPYVVSADPAMPRNHIAECILIANDEEFTDTFHFNLLSGVDNYLVWDPDPLPSSGLVIDSTLQGLQYDGSYSTMLPLDSLDNYHAILVCAGVCPNNYLIGESSPEAQALVEYVNNGGRMYLEGGDVWYYDPKHGGYDFGPLFGIIATSDGYHDMGPIGGAAETFTDGMLFDYSGENYLMDHIEPTGTGFTIFSDVEGIYTFYNCGVANDAGTYRTIGTSFEFGGLVDGTGVSRRRALMDSIMHFFGIINMGADEMTQWYEGIDQGGLCVYPNPFREITTIRFSTGRSVRNELRIYDVSGRLVKSFNLQSTISNLQSSTVWDGRDDQSRIVPAGIYFCQIQAGQQVFAKKIVKLK